MNTENRQSFHWRLGFVKKAEEIPDEWVPAEVPGAVQLDYGRAHDYKPFEKGLNFKQYKWMEDVYWLYEAPLSFTLAEDEKAWLVFRGIDYRYRISVDGKVLVEDEGMFSAVRLDVTAFAGGSHCLSVLIFPVPKADDSDFRDQARNSVKSAACYGWDWHPRLVTSGIWDEAYLETGSCFSVLQLDASYRLTDDLQYAQLTLEAETSAAGPVAFEILGPDGDTAAHGSGEAVRNCGTAGEAEAARNCGTNDGTAIFRTDLTLHDVEKWYPTGYGPQPRYTILFRTLAEDGAVLSECERKIGFRRVQLVMNEDSWREPASFPKSRSDAPATLKQNGRRIFLKGSNFINARLFPGEMTEEVYRRLLTLVKEANMNVLRIWGGGFVNKECFYDLCDEMGIMIWQEFPLACNEYPDDDAYLRVLKKEALSIIRRLRTHPCLSLYCGGNELFNSWSKMTDQHHALRLLDTLTYTEDRFTPFIMTSPLNGMAHGNYNNYEYGEESMQLFARSRNTAYTEFGCTAVSDIGLIRAALSEEEFEALTPGDPVWIAHHNFNEWQPGQEKFPDVDYYFGGYTDLRDVSEKTQFIQAMSYRSDFEEMRRQWPHCAMALNWCFNEVWPMIRSMSLVAYPDVPRPSYEAVKKALRPSLASLKVPAERFEGGSRFTGEVWILNDSNIAALSGGTVRVTLDTGDGPVPLGAFPFEDVAPQTNRCLGAVSALLPNGSDGFIEVRLSVEGRPELDSSYRYVLRKAGPKYVPGTFLNQ